MILQATDTKPQFEDIGSAELKDIEKLIELHKRLTIKRGK